jgi:hypothetical protein
MTSVRDALEAAATEEQRRAQKRAARKQESDKYARFYRSAAWAKCKYAHLKTLARPLRCACCGVTAADARLVVDHIIPLRLPDGSPNAEGWAKRLEGPFQILCNEHNYICKARQADDWRAGANKDELRAS